MKPQTILDCFSIATIAAAFLAIAVVLAAQQEPRDFPMADTQALALTKAVNRRLVAESALKATPQWTEYTAAQAELDKAVAAVRKEAKIPDGCILLNNMKWLCQPKPAEKPKE